MFTMETSGITDIHWSCPDVSYGAKFWLPDNLITIGWFAIMTCACVFILCTSWHMFYSAKTDRLWKTGSDTDDAELPE